MQTQKDQQQERNIDTFMTFTLGVLIAIIVIYG